MPGSRTLFLYFARHYLVWIAITFFSVIGIILLVDTVELLRRASGKEAATADIVLQMALLRAPHLAQEVTPFAILFAGILSLLRLTRSNELVVARASGLSVWQFLMPAIAVALVIGVLKVTVLNTAAALMLGKFEEIEGQVLTGTSSLLAVSSSGVWLREVYDDGAEAVIHAARVEPAEMHFQDPIVFLFEDRDRFTGRIDAEEGFLRGGHWEFHNAWLTGPDRPGTFIEQHSVATSLTAERIQDSFASPDTVPFWQLQKFIRALEATGFSSDSHRLRWHALIAEPLLLVAMVMIAAIFSLRLTRRGGTAVLMATGIVTGFGLYILTNLVHALGVGGSIPIPLAAWVPAGVSLAFGLSALMHLEDG